MIDDLYVEGDRLLNVVVVIEMEEKMERLRNKNILISGGTSGIGLASAQEFEREGPAGTAFSLQWLNNSTLSGIGSVVIETLSIDRRVAMAPRQRLPWNPEPSLACTGTTSTL